MTTYREVGPVADMPVSQVVAAAQYVQQGKVYSLAASRFPGMPLFPGHPPFQVLNYRTPPGIRAEGAQPWGPPNEVGLGYMAEYVMATSHSGTHVDALGHMTIGDDNHWYGGGNTAEHLTDHGPKVGDAEKLPPFFTRGVLLDPPTYRGIDALAAGEPVDAAELEAVAQAQGVEVRPWDVVLIRTGYLKYWPDAEAMAAHKTAGPDLSAAEWLLERGVVATGTDTETYEVQPAPDRGSPANPQPVHTKLLIENGIYLMESVYLEDIAQDRVYEFLFVMLPVKIRGATGSMVDPVAVI
ncbi:MAG: cyclase family protein [Acidimicrobiia bacterium]|nr:cyclase family protein [Acidimicrobiia bacterium]